MGVLLVPYPSLTLPVPSVREREGQEKHYVFCSLPLSLSEGKGDERGIGYSKAVPDPSSPVRE